MKYELKCSSLAVLAAFQVLEATQHRHGASPSSQKVLLASSALRALKLHRGDFKLYFRAFRVGSC